MASNVGQCVEKIIQHDGINIGRFSIFDKTLYRVGLGVGVRTLFAELAHTVVLVLQLCNVAITLSSKLTVGKILSEFSTAESSKFGVLAVSLTSNFRIGVRSESFVSRTEDPFICEMKIGPSVGLECGLTQS